MAVVDSPTVLQAIVYAVGKRMENNRAKTVVRTYTWIQSTIKLVLNVAGFGFLTYAGFSHNIIAGSIVAGLSCFALSWLHNSTTAQPDRSTTDPMQR